ncbi:hypothetical protein Syun_027986 [Stephania yunnanensis]|uniref:Ribonuclease H1 N-terminal domain-containing protein n=1 Tax=Stephania yunnanensis TaxID=152371 RepID=A0AAP0HRR5_9MAGN
MEATSSVLNCVVNDNNHLEKVMETKVKFKAMKHIYSLNEDTGDKLVEDVLDQDPHISIEVLCIIPITPILSNGGADPSNMRPSEEKIGIRSGTQTLWTGDHKDMINWKWYTVFRGWDPGVYGTWYECYKQGINFDGFHYAHFDTKEEAIAGFDRYNYAATIEREVHDQLTLEEGLAELGEIPPPPLPPRMWIEELYEAKGVPLPRSPSIDEEPRIVLFPRDRTLYQRVGSGYEPVMEPWWSD